MILEKYVLIEFNYYQRIICWSDMKLLYFTIRNYDNIIYFDSSLGTWA